MDRTLIAATVFPDTPIVTTDDVTMVLLGLFLTVLLIGCLLRLPRSRPQARRRRAAILELHRTATRRDAAVQQLIQAFSRHRAY
ncbi:MAG: hypothetical protein EXQ87_13585 [Alphaproteobacteria bacterium]|nr:hypothetical protein [Alphaproteobacteria bacterium]